MAGPHTEDTHSLFSPLEMEWRNNAAGLKIQLFASCWLVVQSLSCVPTLCHPKDYSMPGFPVLHHLLERAETHLHGVSDAIQPPHPL